jgi:hypothetical protein
MSAIDSNRVTQSGLDVGEDVAGRDINKTVHHHYGPPIYHEDSVLKNLLHEHEKEKNNDPAYRDFSEELNKFFKKSLISKPRNLEEKLFDGGRDYLIEFAMDAKERVTKKIERYSYFKSAQEIYTYLLTNIRTAFLHEVQAKIKSGKFHNYQIDDIVKIHIIDPFLHNLNGSSLEIDKNELYGLLYFLTGNCYIDWD